MVIDPLRTKIAEQADLHLANLPGTDVLLGWALATELERMGAFDNKFVAANVLGFDEFMARAREWPAARAAAACGVPEVQILTLAQWLAVADPLVMAPGNGLERGRNGGSGIRAAIALPALLGKLGKGSGIDSVKTWLEHLGIEASDDEGLKMTAQVKAFSLKNKRLLTESEFRKIAEEVIAERASVPAK